MNNSYLVKCKFCQEKIEERKLKMHISKYHRNIWKPLSSFLKEIEFEAFQKELSLKGE